jgi:serine/threonine protein kinase
MVTRIGSEIAGFRIESLLARGGMGEVYLATQLFPERKVALKLLPHDLVADPAFRERFIRESNAAASVEHPNIVPVYGAGEADGELWIAMRYVPGEDLRSLLVREGSLPPDRATHICAQVAMRWPRRTTTAWSTETRSRATSSWPRETVPTSPTSA